MKITFQDLEEKITEVRYFRWDTLTICVVEVENGYKVVGTASCADASEYDEALGAEIAYKDAVNKLWPLEGYLLKQDLFDIEYVEPDCTDAMQMEPPPIPEGYGVDPALPPDIDWEQHFKNVLGK
jgi:hypothetical protein